MRSEEVIKEMIKTHTRIADGFNKDAAYATNISYKTSTLTLALEHYAKAAALRWALNETPES